MAATVHRLKITLRSIRPPIWRRVEVDSTLTLYELSAVLEAAIGWLGGHLHAYEADGITYELPDEDSSFRRPTVDEPKARLNKVLPPVGAKMRFDDDVGDGLVPRHHRRSGRTSPRRHRLAAMSFRQAGMSAGRLRWTMGLQRAARHPRQPEAS